MNMANETGKEPSKLKGFRLEPNSVHNNSLSNCLEEIKFNLQKNNRLAEISQKWNFLAGKQLASNCIPLSLKKGVLTIGASHPQWRQALIFTRNQLLSSLKDAGFEIKDIKVQQYHPQKAKGIEPEKNIWANHPSRADIHGLGQCKSCLKPAPIGELSRWGKCGFCQRKDLAK